MADRRPDYKPEPGGNRIGSQARGADLSSSYADLDELHQLLNQLTDMLSEFKEELETELFSYALPVDGSDERLLAAHEQEWPESLGDPPTQVKYRYYKSLKLRSSTSAAYIRRRFEEAARDVKGTTALDLLTIVDLTKDEATLIREFLTAYVDDTSDTSEQRVVETFQDWVRPALVRTKQLREYFETGVTPPIAEESLQTASPEEARRGQAVFKVKLNEENRALTNNVDYLKRNFSDYASVFYDRFLGPSLGFRKKVGLKSVPGQSQQLYKEVSEASAYLEDSLRGALADQARRRTMYSKKTEEIFKSIKKRDQHREAVHQLASVGKPVPTHGPRVLVDAVPEVADLPEAYIEPLPDPEPEPPQSKEVIQEATIKFDTIGNGRLELTGQQMFPYVFLHEPSVSYGATLLEDADPTYWKEPRCSGGVDEWVTNSDGEYIGCRPYVTVDVGYKTDVDGNPVDAEFIKNNSPTPKMRHYIRFRGLTLYTPSEES